MLTVAITGTIASGKSTTAQMFAAAGIPVFSADAAVHALYEGSAVGPIGEAFPGVVVDGVVDRGRLGRVLRNDPAAMTRLEAIVHPMVKAEEQAFLDRARADGKAIAVVEHPLVFEQGDDDRFDAVIVTTAPEGMRRERALSRPRMTPDLYDYLTARQLPDEEKRRRADFVVDTGPGMDAAQSAVRHILAALSDYPGAATRSD